MNTRNLIRDFFFFFFPTPTLTGTLITRTITKTLSTQSTRCTRSSARYSRSWHARICTSVCCAVSLVARLAGGSIGRAGSPCASPCSSCPWRVHERIVMATHEPLAALAQRFLGRRRRELGALEHRRRVRRDRHDKGRPAGSVLLPGLVRRRSSGCGRSGCRRCRRRRRGLQEQDVKLLDVRRGQLQGTAAGCL